MNGRIIKAYIEMKNSQTKNTPSVKSESNPKKIKPRCCSKSNSTKVISK
ncbi:MAG: hypothetical protein IJ358_00525 [Clostridia bacterium]|nr:hypothetical protein [Clostridia bacterium]